MSTFIVRNENVSREKPRRNGADRHREFVSQHKNMTATKAKELGYARDVELPEGEFVLVGDTTGEGTLKCKVFPADHTIKSGLVYTEANKHLLDLPKSSTSVGKFVQEVRIYSKAGVSTITGDTIIIFKSNDKLFFRIGESHKQQEREARARELANKGIYRNY